jgi:predicted transcriptional regulator
MIAKNLESKRLSYRDRVYMVRDIILKLVEYGEVNQTALISFCGLNINKHRSILEKMEDNELITRTDKLLSNRSVAIYKCAPKGYEFCKNILEPYEKLFPRSEKFPPPGDSLTKEHRSLAKINPILIR